MTIRGFRVPLVLPLRLPLLPPRLPLLPLPLPQPLPQPLPLLLVPLLLLLLAAGAAHAGDAAFSDGWRFQQREGASLYAAICAGCHMPQGQGAQGAGAYPRLAGNPRLASGAYVATMVVHGRKAMPSFAQLDDAQIAAVVGYVRREFGRTEADPVQPADVAALRKH